MVIFKILCIMLLISSFIVIAENCTEPNNYIIEKNCTTFQHMTKSINDNYYVCLNYEGEYTIKTNCSNGDILYEDFRSLEDIEKSSQVLKLCLSLAVLLIIITLLFSLYDIKIKKVRL